MIVLLVGLVCVPAFAAGPAGWRTDGSGRYPDATPVTEWSPEKNVVWRAELPSWSNATAVVLADRIFVCSEPTNLLCLNKSDGKLVWALFNNGVAACYDLEGVRKWIVHVDVPPHRDWGHSASPVLHDGKLIVHVAEMKALDAATGKLLWRSQGTKWAWGTPAITNVGDTAVALGPKGQIVGLSDGKVLTSVANGLEYNSPIVADGVAYYIQGKAVAAKLVAAEDGVKAEPVWTVKIKEDRYYSSPVIHNGLIYAVNQKGHLSILDAPTGKVVNGGGQGVALDLGKGTFYPSVTLAGGHVLVSSENGTTVVLKPGPAGEVVATNKLDTFRSSPVFEGKRMYLRTYKYLYCIGE